MVQKAFSGLENEVGQFLDNLWWMDKKGSFKVILL